MSAKLIAIQIPMQAIQIVGPRRLRLADIPAPQLGPGQLRIKVFAAAVCGSDINQMLNPKTVPIVPGHEFSGKVIQIAEDTTGMWRVGDRVTAFPMISCMKCTNCLLGKHRDCDFKLSLGFQLPGAFCEEVVLDERFAVSLPDALSYDQGALVEHLCCGYRLAQEIIAYNLPLTADIVIIGDGPIALANLQMLVFFGYQNIILIGKHQARMNLAVQFGATRVFDYQNKLLLRKKSVAACIFATPAEAVLKQVIPYLAPNAIFFPQTRVRSTELLSELAELNMLFGRAFAYELGDFPIVMQLILDNSINSNLLIADHLTKAEFVEYFTQHSRTIYASKIMIRN